MLAYVQLGVRVTGRLSALHVLMERG